MNTGPYSRFVTEKLILRDLLAIDRTILANERTFLAYVRTALTLLVSGVGVIGLFQDSSVFLTIGITFIIVSSLVFVLGLIKFLKKKDHIDRLVK